MSVYLLGFEPIAFALWHNTLLVEPYETLLLQAERIQPQRQGFRSLQSGLVLPSLSLPINIGGPEVDGKSDHANI